MDDDGLDFSESSFPFLSGGAQGSTQTTGTSILPVHDGDSGDRPGDHGLFHSESVAANVVVFAGSDGLFPSDFLYNPADFVKKHVADRCEDAIARRVVTHAWRKYGTHISAKAFGTRGAGARPLDCYSAYARVQVSDIRYFATISGDANVVFEPIVKGDQHWPCWKCDVIPLPDGVCLHDWIGVQAMRAAFGYAIARAPRKHGPVACIVVGCQFASWLSLDDTLHLTALRWCEIGIG